MTFDIYDTYATGSGGEILRFDVVVAAGTLQALAEMVAAEHAGSANPEIEAQRVGRHPAFRNASVPPEVRAIVKQRGFAIIPKRRRLTAAA